MTWSKNLLFFMIAIGLVYLGMLFCRSMLGVSLPFSQTDKDIVKFNKINKSSAIISASDKHTASLIFLHGLGGAGEHSRQIFHIYHIPKTAPYIKFIFPSAPVRNITVYNGMSMPGWFNLFGFDQSTKEDEMGILVTSKYINDLIEEEIQNGISSERIIIGGFSQGGAITLHTALTTPHTLAGVLALSTWLPLSSTFPQALISGDKKVNLPILQCHGKEDRLIQLEWGRLSEQLFKSMGFKQYMFKKYDGIGHGHNDQEMKDMISFIIQYLPRI